MYPCAKLQNALVTSGSEWPTTRSGLVALMRAVFTEINHYLVHPPGECSRLTKPERWQREYGMGSSYSSASISKSNYDYQRSAHVNILLVVPDDHYNPSEIVAAYQQMPLRPEFERRYGQEDAAEGGMRVGCPQELLACDDYITIDKFQVASARYLQSSLERGGFKNHMLVVLDPTLSSTLARGFMRGEWDPIDSFAVGMLERWHQEFRKHYFKQTTTPAITAFDGVSAKAHAERQAQLDRTVDQEWVPPFVFYVGREIDLE